MKKYDTNVNVRVNNIVPLTTTVDFITPKAGVDGILKECYHTASRGSVGVKSEADFIISTIKKCKNKPNVRDLAKQVELSTQLIEKRIKAIVSSINMAYKMDDKRYVVFHGKKLYPIDVITTGKTSLDIICDQLNKINDTFLAVNKDDKTSPFEDLLTKAFSAQEMVNSIMSEKSNQESLCNN